MYWAKKGAHEQLRQKFRCTSCKFNKNTTNNYLITIIIIISITFWTGIFCQIYFSFFWKIYDSTVTVENILIEISQKKYGLNKGHFWDFSVKFRNRKLLGKGGVSMVFNFIFLPSVKYIESSDWQFSASGRTKANITNKASLTINKNSTYLASQKQNKQIYQNNLPNQHIHRWTLEVTKKGSSPLHGFSELGHQFCSQYLFVFEC